MSLVSGCQREIALSKPKQTTQRKNNIMKTNTTSPALQLLALVTSIQASGTKEKFNAAMTHEEHKGLIQGLRDELGVTEKTLMGLVLLNIDKEKLKASAEEYKAAVAAAKVQKELEKTTSAEALKMAQKEAAEAAKAAKIAEKAKAAAEKAAAKAAEAADEAKSKMEAIVESRTHLPKDEAPAAPAPSKKTK